MFFFDEHADKENTAKTKNTITTETETARNVFLFICKNLLVYLMCTLDNVRIYLSSAKSGYTVHIL